MADKRINQLPVSSGLTDDGLLVVYQNGVTKSVTGSLIKKFATVGGVYVGKEEPTDDRVLVWITVEDEGDAPVVPDEPTATKLATPTIRLDTDNDSGEDVPDAGTLTPAILGVAVLGRTILGMTDVGGEKLAAPEIELVEV